MRPFEDTALSTGLAIHALHTAVVQGFRVFARGVFDWTANFRSSLNPPETH